MNYISEIFGRLSLQHIREFLLHGTAEASISTQSYFNRLKSAEKLCTGTLHNSFPNEDEYDRIINDIYALVTATQDIYMEIGLRCGAALAIQLLDNPNNE